MWEDDVRRSKAMQEMQEVQKAHHAICARDMIKQRAIMHNVHLRPCE
jgi:hypothetical protein